MSAALWVQNMNTLSLTVAPPDACSPEEPGRIRLAVGDIVLTRLLRQPGSRLDEALIAAPDALAFWLCDHWWRLRWETIPQGRQPADWRLAHELTSVGGGFAWPRISIWGDADRVGLLGRADPVGVVGPVRYLTDALVYVEASGFEGEVDRFLDRVADEHSGFGSDRVALRALITALRQERCDPEVALWRRLEARLGYDPDAGPDEVVEAVGELAAECGLAGVEEAVAATPGAEAPSLLVDAIARAKRTGHACDFSGVLAAVSPARPLGSDPPWMAAEAAAAGVRAAFGVAPGPIKPTDLGEILGTSRYSFRNTPRRDERPYGLRVHASGSVARQRVSLRTRSPQARRFELCRALGDALWSPSDTLGPLADTATDRQKFQRAFAQSLLCPYEDLRGFLATDQPTEDDIEAAATHFHVNPSVITTLRWNKGQRVSDKTGGADDVADRLEAA